MWTGQPLDLFCPLSHICARSWQHVARVIGGGGIEIAVEITSISFHSPILVFDEIQICYFWLKILDKAVGDALLIDRRVTLPEKTDGLEWTYEVIVA